MVRLVVYLVGLSLVAVGLSWLADNPGDLTVRWQGYDVQVTVFKAVVLLTALIAFLFFIWSMGRAVWNSPASIGEKLLRRRQKRGLDAISSGMVAVGAGDTQMATRYALQARKTLPHEPLTHLLRAQAAQLSGDRATARRIFEAMLASPETEQLGLRGLFLEAQREGATEAARQYAERALRSNAKLGWSTDALFDLQCRQNDWVGALETLALAKRNGMIDKTTADRRRAVLLAGQAQDAEDNEAEKALTLALEAHQLAPDLVPAAAVAGRILAARGNTAKAARILQKTWTRAPHPELAAVYAYARSGDSSSDRVERIRQLANLNPHSIESPIAVATTAIESRQFDDARRALEPLLDHRLTQRVATLMARLEASEHGDKGRVREWLARSINAARDPAWTADGVVSERWQPVSPVTGHLDTFQWRVPVEKLEDGSSDLINQKIEELLAISAPAVMAAPEIEAHAADDADAENVATGIDRSAAEIDVGILPPAEVETPARPLARSGAGPASVDIAAAGDAAAAKPVLDAASSNVTKLPSVESGEAVAAPDTAARSVPHLAPSERNGTAATVAPDDTGPDDTSTVPKLNPPKRVAGR